MAETEKIIGPLEIESRALKIAFDAVSEYSAEFDDRAFELILEAHTKIYGKNLILT